MITWWPGLSLEANEKQIIEAAYSFYKKNKTATASSLGISIRTLDAKLERYKEQNEELQRLTERAAADRQALLQRFRGQPSQVSSNPEPVAKVPEKSSVPLQADKPEVQKVLPTQNARTSSSPNKNR